MSEIRLSEAMRLGAMMSPQCRYRYLSDDGRTCAWGAAFQACSMSHDQLDIPEQAAVRWPVALQRAKCPVCEQGNLSYGVTVIIMHLNDSHRWTREEIADWVEQQERLLEAPAPVEQPEEAVHA